MVTKPTFIEELSSKLKTEKNLSDSTIKAYIRNLVKLNNDEPFKSFTFLNDINKTQKQLEEYKENTKRNYLISIVSVLSLFKNVLKTRRLHDKYYNLMMSKNEQLKKDVNPQDLTETQEKNWIPWEKILEIHKSLFEKVDEFMNKTNKLSENQYNLLLSFLVLSLYVYIPPRRNKDWMLCDVIKKNTPELSKDRNYLDLTDKTFIFNVYKTSKKYNTQVIKIPDELMYIINHYLQYHPLYTKKLPNPIPFLVYFNKTALDKVNSITRLLNKVFHKAIGSSMIRHIFLTQKYGDIVDEQKEDAYKMAHSEAQQKDYIKKPKKDRIIVQL